MSNFFREKLPIVRGQIYGCHISGSLLADSSYHKTGKYKYFVVLQGDDAFGRHPYRAVAFINTLQPPYITTQSQLSINNISSQFVNPPERIDRGYIDLTFMVMLPVTVIREADYAGHSRRGNAFAIKSSANGGAWNCFSTTKVNAD